MYQFPDPNEMMREHEPEPIINTPPKRSRFKIIIIANLLLALFIAGVVWFLFFFDSKFSIDLPWSLKTENTSISGIENGKDKEFTPVIINTPETEAKTSIQNQTKKIQTIQTITGNLGNSTKEIPTIIQKEVMTSSISEANTETKTETEKVSINKDNKAVENPKPLSDIDVIANELMKLQSSTTNKTIQDNKQIQNDPATESSETKKPDKTS